MGALRQEGVFIIVHYEYKVRKIEFPYSDGFLSYALSIFL